MPRMPALTVPQAYALLNIAGMTTQSSAPAVWFELGYCLADLLGADMTKVDPAAQAYVVRAGYAYNVPNPNGRFPFALTAHGISWCEQLAAVSSVTRGMRGLTKK